MLRNDWKIIRRDRMTMAILIAPFVLIILLKLFFDFLAGYPIGAVLTPILFTVVIVMLPLLFGIVTGFMIIEEKEENVFVAIRIMPISSNQYLLYRVGGGFVFTFLVAIGVPLFFPAFEFLWYELVGIAFIISLECPLIAIFLSTFAKNKIEGIAMLKIVNVFLNVPLVYFFLDDKWQYLIGVIPTYWPMKIVLTTIMEGEIGFFFYLGGLAIHIALFLLSLLYFRKKVFS